MNKNLHARYVRLVNLLQRLEETKQGYVLKGMITLEEKSDLRIAIDTFAIYNAKELE